MEKEVLIHIENESELKVYFDNELVCESDSRTDPIHLLESVLASLGFTVEVVNVDFPDSDEEFEQISDGEPYYEEDPIDLLED